MSRDQIARILAELKLAHPDGMPAPWLPGATFIAIPWLQEFLVEIFQNLQDRPAGIMPTPEDFASYMRVVGWRVRG